MCQGVSHFSGFAHHFIQVKLATSSQRVKPHIYNTIMTFKVDCSVVWWGGDANMCTICVQYVYNMCTICVQYVYIMCTIGVQYVYNMCTICVHYVYNMCTICVQYVYIMCTICVQYVYNMCTICLQYVYIMCTICVQYVYNMCTICVQYVYIMCTICVQYVYNMYTCSFTLAGLFVKLKFESRFARTFVGSWCIGTCVRATSIPVTALVCIWNQ